MSHACSEAKGTGIRQASTSKNISKAVVGNREYRGHGAGMSHGWQALPGNEPCHHACLDGGRAGRVLLGIAWWEQSSVPASEDEERGKSVRGRVGRRHACLPACF